MTHRQQMMDQSGPQVWRRQTCRWQTWLLGGLCMVALLATLGVGAALAQDEPEPDGEPEPLYRQEPYDTITIKDGNTSVQIKVLPIPRPVPQNPRSTDKLTIKRVEDPSETFEIIFRDIEKIDLFENVLLAEAVRLTRTSDFDKAFDYFAVLRKRYPETPGLKESMQEFLFRNAGQHFTRKEFPQALAVLEELYRINPNYSFGGSNTVAKWLDRVAGEVVTSYMSKQPPDIASTQAILTRLGNAYGQNSLTSVVSTREKLDAMATVKRDAARQAMESGRLREAHQAVKEMLRIWPQVEGGLDLAIQVERRYPLVVVGVSQLSKQHDPRRLDNWSARRTGRLRHRMLMELAGPGPEGGYYVCPLGTAAQSEDRRGLTIQLTPPADSESAASALTGFDVSKRLRGMCNPDGLYYNEPWASLMSHIQVEDIYRVHVDFRRAYVLPEAHLQVYMNPKEGQLKETQPSSGPYVVAERQEQQMRFIRNPNYQLGKPSQPAEIIERYFEDPREAVAALIRGEVDLVDRVLPAEAELLKENKSLRVGRYPLPTIHVLVPNYNNPYMKLATFRRGLAYGIAREKILKNLILDGKDVPGCAVVSGPFPRGMGPQDPLAYAYDKDIEPRKYNPRLAATLAKLTQFQLDELAKIRGEKPPVLQPLVLAHPNEFLARLTCEVIAKQLVAIGIECKLQALPPGASVDPTGKADLVYTELAVWEPIIDARRIVSTQGLAKTDNQYVDLACRRLDTTSNWRNAAQRLRDLHAIAHNEAIVIPLWQIADHYVHHPRVQKIGRNPVSLYHEVEQWQVMPRVGS